MDLGEMATDAMRRATIRGMARKAALKVLAVIAANPESGAKTIVRKSEGVVSRQSVGAVLDALVAKGLVVREPSRPLPHIQLYQVTRAGVVALEKQEA